MNKPSKCKNCQWYGKPYWSIINPCDNCPNENNVEIITIGDTKPIQEILTEKEIKKLIKEKEDLQKRFNSLLEAHKICDEQNMDYTTRIDKAIEHIKRKTKEVDCDNDRLVDVLNILQGSDTNE